MDAAVLQVRRQPRGGALAGHIPPFGVAVQRAVQERGQPLAGGRLTRRRQPDGTDVGVVRDARRTRPRPAHAGRLAAGEQRHPCAVQAR
jgi:hypothetical protein